MANKEELQRLTNNIQSAVKALETNQDGWMKVSLALDKMRQAIEPPQNALMRQRFHNVCVIIGLEIGLFAELAGARGESRSAADLAKLTGFDEVFIARVMRLLAGIGFVDETGYQQWVANPVTVGQADAGSAGGIVLTNEMIFPIGRNIRQFLRQHKPCCMESTPPMYDVAMGETVWETLKTNAEWKKAFDDNMSMRNKMLSIPWHNKYPAHDRLTSERKDAAGLLEKPTVVDIGGNQGVDLQRFADSFPDLDCDLILQDLPKTIAGISAKLDPRIRAEVYDFFTAQPIRGADIYYLKSILHDWDDTQSIRILSTAARAMSPGSRLLINEMVLQDTNELLLRADMDMLMFFLSNGMERTNSQWVQLLERVDPPLRLIGVFSAPGDQQSVIESVLANRGQSL